MTCTEQRLTAYFDEQLDVGEMREVQHHLKGCPDCSAGISEMTQLRQDLRREITAERAPSSLRVRVLSALDNEVVVSSPESTRPSAWWRSRVFWAGGFSGISGAAAAAAVAWLLVLSPTSKVMESDLVAAHVHSLLPQQLIAVVSTDRHTVKPWFAGRADVSPAVEDFEAAGFKLLGGRSDVIFGQRAAVMVYRRGAHTINVFSWASDRSTMTKDTTRNGYHLEFWKVGNVRYCAVSDISWDELKRLGDLIRQLALREEQPAAG